MCTVAAIIALYGSMPAPGTVIIVPRQYVAQCTSRQKSQVIQFAERHGVKLREGE